MASEPHLRLVDPDAPPMMVIDMASGEQIAPLEDFLQSYEYTVRNLKGKITKLERDEEATARKHEHWAQAHALFDWWALATNHEGVSFAADEFYAVLPRLKEGRTPIDILRGIAGIAFDPNTKPKRNGGVERFDSWDLLNRSGAKLERYGERAPGWPVSDTQWRVWLVRKIEAGFRA